MTDVEIQAALAAHRRGGGVVDDDMPKIVRLLHETSRHYRVSTPTARIIAQAEGAPNGYAIALAKRADRAELIAYTTADGEPPKPYDLAIARRRELEQEKQR
jgi:hypothetical protein